MLKFLTIFFILSYVIYKIGGFFFKGIFMSSAQRQAPPHSQRKAQKAPDSDLNIDYVPKRGTQKKDFDGGEYVDYEEV